MGAISHWNAHFPPGACSRKLCVSTASTPTLASCEPLVQRILFLRRIKSSLKTRIYVAHKENLSLNLRTLVEECRADHRMRASAHLIAHSARVERSSPQSPSSRKKMKRFTPRLRRLPSEPPCPSPRLIGAIDIFHSSRVWSGHSCPLPLNLVLPLNLPWFVKLLELKSNEFQPRAGNSNSLSIGRNYTIPPNSMKALTI
jgi:hypothetical protein